MKWEIASPNLLLKGNVTRIVTDGNYRAEMESLRIVNNGQKYDIKVGGNGRMLCWLVVEDDDSKYHRPVVTETS